jgi:hypothetical protein
MGAALPASAQSTSAARAAAKQDAVEWHQKLLAKYKQLHYLDADGKPMTATAFLEIVEARSAGFTMVEGADRTELTLKVLKPGATQESAAEWHQKLLAKYKQLHYLDADGKPMTAAAFMEIVEARSAGFTMTEGADGAELTLKVLKPGATR